MIGLVSNTFNPRINNIGGVQYLIDTYINDLDQEHDQLFLRKNLIENAICLVQLIKKRKNYQKFVFFGYADVAIIFYALIAKILSINLEVIPAFHPWWTLRRRRLGWLYEKILFRMLFRNAKVFCLSSTEVGYMRALLGPNSQVSILKKFHVMLQSELNNLEYENIELEYRKYDLLFIGRSDHNKRIDKFIELIEHFSENKSVKGAAIINLTNKKDEVSLTHRLRELGIDLYSTLTRSEYFEILKQSKCLVVPSRWESFSFASCEVIYLGGKVIVSSEVLAFENLDQECSIMKIQFDDYNFMSIQDFLDFIYRPTTRQKNLELLENVFKKFL